MSVRFTIDINNESRKNIAQAVLRFVIGFKSYKSGWVDEGIIFDTPESDFVNSPYCKSFYLCTFHEEYLGHKYGNEMQAASLASCHVMDIFMDKYSGADDPKLVVDLLALKNSVCADDGVHYA